MAKYEVCNDDTGKCMKSFDNYEDAFNYAIKLNNPELHSIKTPNGREEALPWTYSSTMKKKYNTSDKVAKMNDNDFWSWTIGRRNEDMTSSQYQRYLKLRSDKQFQNARYTTVTSRRKSSSKPKSNTKSSSMWRMSNKQIYDAIKSKSYSAKQRRFMSYILSTRRK